MVKSLLIGFGMVTGIVLLSGGAIFYIRSHQDAVASVGSGGTPVGLSLAETSPTKSIALNTSPPTQSKSTTSNSNGLSVSSSASASSPAGSNKSASAPGPEDFSQYEQYKDKTAALMGEIRTGDGAAADVNKKVAVNYRGWLTNGKQFDESYSKGQPFIFTVGEHKVILGWEEAIVGMKVGGKRRFVIPPSVGYGAQPPTGIPANAVLVFDVELVAIQ